MDISKNKGFNLTLNKKSALDFLAASALSIILTLASTEDAAAGAFIYAGSANGENLISHPRGYNGTGGKLDVRVCIVPNTPNTTSMEQPVKNAIAYWNKRQPTTSNLRSHLPGGTGNIDFESVFVHELGHCVGLAHPNLATESGKQGDERNYTKSTQGDDFTYDIAPGADNIIGSADDIRGDDKNLHWFKLDNNNPFSIASVIDTSTYARKVSQLPNGDLFAANGDRTVSTLFNAPNSEAIMQQRAFPGEIQRTLLHDDVATLKLAMSGIDETANTGDDYTLNLVYAGISNQNCDINVSFNDAKTGFAVCKSSANLSRNHVLLSSTDVFFDPDFNWYFNTAPQCSQSTHLKAGKWRMISMPCQLGISTPNSVEAVFGDDLPTAGYGTQWVLYEYLPASGYRKLELTDGLEEGRGYWIISLDDKTITVLGEYNSNIDFPLGDGSTAEQWNLAGTPFRFDTTWGDVQVIDTDGSVLTLDEAAPDTIANTGFHWNSETEAYDQLTPNSGVLSPFDGVWVYSKKAGTALRVPMSNAERITQ